MATDYGFLNSMAQGIKEGVTAYQTISKNKRDEQQFNLANGLMTNPVTGELDFTPEKKQQLKVAQLQTQRQGDALDPNSSYSLNQQKIASGILGPKMAPYLEGQSAADIKENQPLFNTKLKADETASIRGLLAEKKNTADHGKADQKEIASIRDDLDPNKARGGNLAKSQAMINSAERLDALFKQFPDYNVPKGQTVELASAIAGLVNGGSAQSQHQIDQMVPQSLRGNSNAIASWLTNEPTGMQQQAFMKMMHETVGREREVAYDQVKNAQIQRLSAHTQFAQSQPEIYKGLLQAYDVDPETIVNGRYTPKKKEAGGDHGGGNPNEKVVNGVTYVKVPGGWQEK